MNTLIAFAFVLGVPLAIALIIHLIALAWIFATDDGEIPTCSGTVLSGVDCDRH